METCWREDLNHIKEEKIKLCTAAIVFMDGTIWIALSKTNLQKILDEATIFYKANDFQINSKKSVLLTINAPKNNPDDTVLLDPTKNLSKKWKKLNL